MLQKFTGLENNVKKILEQLKDASLTAKEKDILLGSLKEMVKAGDPLLERINNLRDLLKQETHVASEPLVNARKALGIDEMIKQAQQYKELKSTVI